MASEKKMCQIRDMYEANKGKDGVTISKICKQSGVLIAEYVKRRVSKGLFRQGLGGLNQ